ncbi:aldo/keto reductase [Blastomonas fulva]|uniref:aldo/keto reductase n=1 Tax=Blastomonas fulva TaxID=1550728 RepID=UPI0025A3223B|nr:aldo/keto reductase [Blastomonas fulva]MDM7928558.1 aldo/keto reductase [Blastomonas fulva]MDM7966651.1 aldo/keto reductase [Blastomonas fulva]
MKYINLGASGLVVSRICLGCMSFGRPGAGRHEWTIDEADSRTIMRQALEGGINFFDTANEYSAGTSEEFVGKAIADFAHRDEIVLATKAYVPWRAAPNTGGLSRKALFQAIDDSLTRLGTDYVDLFQIHRWDYGVPIEETMEALHHIVKAGKARYIGASSMYAWQFAKAQYTAERHGWTRFISMQPQVNLVYREEEREMIPLCIDQGVGVLPWSPLARGMLTRDWNEKTARSQTDMFSAYLYRATADNDRQIVEAVAAVALERGLPRAQIAMAWLLGKAGITAPIIGATKPSHLHDAIAAVDVTLSPDEVKRLESPYLPHAVVGLAGPLPVGGQLTLKDAQ